MRIELQYFDGCPNWRLAEARLREVLGAPEFSAATLELHRIEDERSAAEAGFRGSPTIVVGGIDLFAQDAAEGGLSCRLYPTEVALEGSPSVAQLRRALRRAIA